MSSIEDLVRGAIVDSPFGRIVGIRAETVEADLVRLRLPFRPEVVTVGDVIHGGAIASLVDTAAVAAAWSGADPGKASRGATISFTINYLAAGRGQDLIATAHVIRRGGTIVVCEVDVLGNDGTAVARALVTYKLG